MPLIAVVTPLFPIDSEAYRGKPIYKTVLSLQKHADVRVFCPLTNYPPFFGPTYRHSKADTSYKPEGVDVKYFTYPVFPLLSRPVNGVVCARELARVLEDIPFDLILAYWLYPDGFASVKVARHRGKPVIVGARGSDLRRIDPVTRHFVRNTVIGADRVLTVSEDLRRRAIDLGVQPEKVHTILNGCDHHVFRPMSRAQVRRELRVPEQHQLILFVGALIPFKGALTLMNAFAILAARNPRLHLLFIGEGKAAAGIKAFSEAHGLQDRVRMVGAMAGPDIAKWLNAADVMCLPSYSEGCPNVVLEATAAGCPVVATDVGGIPEIVTSENGILISTHDPSTLAGALRSALERSWDREAISRGSTRAWDHVAAETYEVCREVMKPLPHGARSAPAVHGARERLRITVVTPYFPIAEEPYRGHSAFHTLRYMKKKADIRVICPIAVYPRTKWLTPIGFRYRRVDLSYKPPELETTYFEYPALPIITRPFNGLVCASLLKRYLLSSKPDVILNYWVYPEGFAAVRLGRECGIPVVVGSIGSDILRPGDAISARLMQYTLRSATAVLTVSDDLRLNAIRLGVPAERVTTVLNGCEQSVFFPRDRDGARAEVGVPQDAELLLYVGWISPTKGLVELVDSVAALSARHPRLKLALIGEGRAQQDLERRARAAGVGDRLTFLGRKSSAEVAQWLAVCDVFCLPSYSEGCPNAILESISCGRPVVATNVGGIPELLNDHCGIMVPPRSTGELTNALHEALNRVWDHHAIAVQFGRSWESAAEETFRVCCRAAGMPPDLRALTPPLSV